MVVHSDTVQSRLFPEFHMSAVVQWIWFFCHPKARGCALNCKHRLQAAWAPLCCSSAELPSAANPRTKCCCLPAWAELCQCLLGRVWQSLGVCKATFTLLGAARRQKSGVRKSFKITSNISKLWDPISHIIYTFPSLSCKPHFGTLMAHFNTSAIVASETYPVGHRPWRNNRILV